MNKIPYLRICVTEKCGHRCLYCRPGGEASQVSCKKEMSLRQILSLVKIMSAHGISDLKITGGEPLTRNDIPKMVELLLAIKGIKRIELVTRSHKAGKIAEQCLSQYSQKNNLPISVVRPVYVYGPYDQSGRMDYFFERISEERPIIISGTGENIVQFGYVHDLCEVIVAMIGNEAAYGQAFNISGRELVTISQFIDLVSSVIAIKANVRFNANNQEEASALTNKHRFADIGKAERTLGIIPETSLSDGLKATYQWWLKRR